MEITINKIDDGNFEVLLGETRIELDFDSLEHLHAQMSAILRPETVAEKRKHQQEFLVKLSSASDSGIQSLLRTAASDDILVLLHTSEKEKPLKKKLYGNMSENSIKMYIEDMLFKFSDGVKSYQFDEAMTRLIKTVDQLEMQGALSYDPPSDQP